MAGDCPDSITEHTPKQCVGRQHFFPAASSASIRCRLCLSVLIRASSATIVASPASMSMVTAATERVRLSSGLSAPLNYDLPRTLHPTLHHRSPMYPLLPGLLPLSRYLRSNPTNPRQLPSPGPHLASKQLYGCSMVVLICFTCPAITTRFIGFNKICHENIIGKRAASGGAGLG